MSELDTAVLAYYESNAQREHRWLDREDCALEFTLTTRLLADHLPAGARVLELGGGSGRYARWLAGQGHRVVLTDLPRVARDRPRGEYLREIGPAVEAIVPADARDLSRWSEGEFDAVVALGPFDHLTIEEGRLRAASELSRVLRPGGIACVALIPRYAVLRGVLADSSSRLRLRDPAFLASLLEDGVFFNDQPGRFTGIYGVEPNRSAALLESEDFATVAVHAIEGFASDLQGAGAELKASAPAAYATLLDTLHAHSTDPSFFGTSNHLLWVGRKLGRGEPPLAYRLRRMPEKARCRPLRKAWMFPTAAQSASAKRSLSTPRCRRRSPLPVGGPSLHHVIGS